MQAPAPVRGEVREAAALRALLQATAARFGAEAAGSRAAQALERAAGEERPSPPAVLRCVELLVHAGRPEEAEALCHAMLAAFPVAAASHAGLARVAARRRDWDAALRHWERALQAAARPSPAWQAGRADALLGLGRLEEAEAAFRALLQAAPESPAGQAGLLRVLRAAHRPDRLLAELEAGSLREPRSMDAASAAISALIDLYRLGAARGRFGGALALMRRPAHADRLLALIPRLFEGAERIGAWRSLQAALPDPGTEAAAGYGLVRLRLHLALRGYGRFREEAGPFLAAGGGGRLAPALAAALAALRDPGFPDRMRPKVFVIGLSKTGTSSMRRALEMLGLAAIHWANPLTQELIGEEDVLLFDAFADITVSHAFERLCERFPNSRCIYTQRPLPEWRASFTAHYARAHGTGDFARLRALMAGPDAFHWGSLWREIQNGLYFRHASPEAAYRAHEERVMRFFRARPAERFLAFDIFAGDGWPKLCAFLGRPVPQAPFPRENVAPGADSRSRAFTPVRDLL